MFKQSNENKNTKAIRRQEKRVGGQYSASASASASDSAKEPIFWWNKSRYF